MRVRTAETVAVVLCIAFMISAAVCRKNAEVPPAVAEIKAAEAESAATRDINEKSGQSININTASMEELTELYGVGETIARRIVEYRQANGGFEDIKEITKVEGIGPKTFEAIMYEISTE